MLEIGGTESKRHAGIPGKHQSLWNQSFNFGSITSIKCLSLWSAADKQKLQFLSGEHEYGFLNG